MSLKNVLKTIFKLNKFHGRIIILALYLERCSNRILLLNILLKIFRKIIIQGIYHCDITPNSFCDKTAISTLRLPHPYLIIIHGKAIIGHNATIFHNVTIGVIEGNNRYKFAPTILDNVYIGTGASILGDVKIANNCKIGAHSLVLKDITDPNTTIVGTYK